MDTFNRLSFYQPSQDWPWPSHNKRLIYSKRTIHFIMQYSTSLNCYLPRTLTTCYQNDISKLYITWIKLCDKWDRSNSFNIKC